MRRGFTVQQAASLCRPFVSITDQFATLIVAGYIGSRPPGAVGVTKVCEDGWYIWGADSERTAAMQFFKKAGDRDAIDKIAYVAQPRFVC